MIVTVSNLDPTGNVGVNSRAALRETCMTASSTPWEPRKGVSEAKTTLTLFPSLKGGGWEKINQPTFFICRIAARRSVFSICVIFIFCFVIAPFSCDAQTYIGVRCLAILDTGAPIIIRMNAYSAEKCQQTAQVCLRGRPAKEIKYFDQVMAMETQSPMVEPLPESCDADQRQSSLGGNSTTLGASQVVHMAPESRKIESNPEYIEPPIDDIVSKLENYVFVKNDEYLRNIDDKKNRQVTYDFLGYYGGDKNILYVGGEKEFSNLFFESYALFFETHPEVSFSLFNNRHSSDEKSYFAHLASADVVAFVTDEKRLVGRLRSDDFEVYLLQLMNIAPDSQFTWQKRVLFDKSCFLWELIRNGQIERTFAVINGARIGAWSFQMGETAPRGSILPSACVAAALLTHVGFKSIEDVKADELVTPAPDGSGDMRVNHNILYLVRVFRGLGVTEGMSRAEFAEHVRKFLNEHKLFYR